MNEYFASDSFKYNLKCKYYWYQNRDIKRHLIKNKFNRDAFECDFCDDTSFLCDFCCRGSLNSQGKYGFYKWEKKQNIIQWIYIKTH